MTTLYAYIRVSTVKQGERGSSLQEQRAAIEGYAHRHGLTISEWFEEQETAAKRGRAVFNNMLKLLDKGRARGVIIHKIDRSARNLRDWADLGELIDRGVEVHFAHESVDLQTRGGRLSADIQAVVASDFIRNLRDEVRKGFVGRLKQGFYPLPAPLGYTDQGGGKAKTPDLATAPLIRRAFELYATGQYNLRTLGKELHRLGLRNRRGGRVGRSSLSDILNNEFYIGIVRIKKTGAVYQGVHEPIITKSLFDRVRAILQGKTQHHGLKHDFVYRKTLRCTHCGYRLLGELQKGTVYYRCHTRTCPRTSLREDDIVSQVETALEQLTVPSEELPLWAEEFRKLLRTSKDDQEHMTQSLKLRHDQINARLSRLTDAYIDRLIDREAFEHRKTALLHERAAVQEQLDLFASGTNPMEAKVQKFLELLKAVSGNADCVFPAERRDLLKEATSNLSVDQNRLVVDWLSHFSVVAKRYKNAYGGPQRDTPRTFVPDGHEITYGGPQRDTHRTFVPDGHKITYGGTQRDTPRICEWEIASAAIDAVHLESFQTDQRNENLVRAIVRRIFTLLGSEEQSSANLSLEAEPETTFHLPQ